MAFRPASRLDQLPPYLFIEIDRRKRAALNAGRDVIDLGVGDPDQATPGFIIDRMAQAVYDPRNHRYPFGAGVPVFREAAARWFHRRFGVVLEPQAEVLVLIGSKEGLGHLPFAVLNPGQAALVPTPGYPVYEAATIFAGGLAYHMPLNEADGFLPNLDEIPADVLDRTALMFLNYPNNPTGAVAPRGFYEKCVRLAQRHGFIICSDAAYAEVYFDDHDPPHSILEVPGAREVCVEMHSLSKTFNMTGWRIAFAVGSAAVLAALAKVKGNMDSGVFNAIQEAGVTALENAGRPEVADLRKMYQDRRDLLVSGLQRAGFQVRPPAATFYVWARCPPGHDSMACVSRMLDEAAVMAIPGIGFGQSGEGYIRFALTVERERIIEAVERLAKMEW
jgi:LL-diaminopimelate aminotransferase